MQCFLLFTFSLLLSPLCSTVITYTIRGTSAIKDHDVRSNMCQRLSKVADPTAESCPEEFADCPEYFQREYNIDLQTYKHIGASKKHMCSPYYDLPVRYMSGYQNMERSVKAFLAEMKKRPKDTRTKVEKLTKQSTIPSIVDIAYDQITSTPRTAAMTAVDNEIPKILAEIEKYQKEENDLDAKEEKAFVEETIPKNEKGADTKGSATKGSATKVSGKDMRLKCKTTEASGDESDMECVQKETPASFLSLQQRKRLKHKGPKTSEKKSQSQMLFDKLKLKLKSSISTAFTEGWQCVLDKKVIGDCKDALDDINAPVAKYLQFNIHDEPATSYDISYKIAISVVDSKRFELLEAVLEKLAFDMVYLRLNLNFEEDRVPYDGVVVMVKMDARREIFDEDGSVPPDSLLARLHSVVLEFGSKYIIHEGMAGMGQVQDIPAFEGKPPPEFPMGVRGMFISWVGMNELETLRIKEAHKREYDEDGYVWAEMFETVYEHLNQNKDAKKGGKGDDEYVAFMKKLVLDAGEKGLTPIHPERGNAVSIVDVEAEEDDDNEVQTTEIEDEDSDGELGEGGHTVKGTEENSLSARASRAVNGAVKKVKGMFGG